MSSGRTGAALQLTGRRRWVIEGPTSPATPDPIRRAGELGLARSCGTTRPLLVQAATTQPAGETRPCRFLHGAVWVANHSRPWSVTRIDVESRQVTDTVPIPVEHPHTPLASDGVIWVYTQEGKLLRIDPGMASE